MRALVLLLLATSAASAQETGSIAGQVLEADGVTAIIGANVRVAGTTLGAATDLDGNFRIIGVSVGSYDVTAFYAGYPTVSVTGVVVEAGATRTLAFTLDGSGYADTGCCFCDYRPPLITNDAIGQSRLLTGWDLENMPVNR